MTRLIESLLENLQERNEKQLAVISTLPRYIAQLYVTLKEGDSDLETLERNSFPHISELKDNLLSDEDADRLKRALQDYAKGPLSNYTPIALLSLGYFFDRALVPFLQLQLQRHLEDGDAADHALGQCIIALDTLDERILLDGSFSAAEPERNREMAHRYLSNITS